MTWCRSRASTYILQLVFLWTCSIELLKYAASISSVEQRGPIFAHPLNPPHIDRRFGIPIEPGVELLTGDIITFAIDGDIRMGDLGDDSSIISVLGLDEDGYLRCEPPRLVPITVLSDGEYGYGYASSYGHDPRLLDRPTGVTTKMWVPTLDQMFVVNIVDGRLGLFTLSPHLTPSDKPIYIGARPAVARSGILSRGRVESAADGTIRTGVFIDEDDVAVQYYIPPSDPMQASVESILLAPAKGKQAGAAEDAASITFASARFAFRVDSFHDYSYCSGSHLVAPRLSAPVDWLPSQKSIRASLFRIERIPMEIVRRLTDSYISALHEKAPRRFFLFSAMPRFDRVDQIHYHGADAELNARHLLLGQLKSSSHFTLLEQQNAITFRARALDVIRYDIDVEFQAEVVTLLDFIPIDFADIGGLVPIDTNILDLLMSGLTSSAFPFGFIGDATALVFVIDVRLGYSIDAASFVEFGGDFAVMCPAGTQLTGHVTNSIGFARVPFSLDVVRYENYWPALWMGDLLTDPGNRLVPIDPCLGGTLAHLNPIMWTIRNAMRTETVQSLLNPFGYTHPAFQMDHFQITGEFTGSFTFFQEFVVERTL